MTKRRPSKCKRAAATQSFAKSVNYLPQAPLKRDGKENAKNEPICIWKQSVVVSAKSEPQIALSRSSKA